MSAIRDAIQPLANAFLADFPTRAERLRFIETARKALSYVDAFKALPDRQRRAWLTGPIETDAQEANNVLRLVVMIKGIIKRAQDHRTKGKPVPARLQRQERFASLILKGLSQDTRKAELIAIERDLLKLYNATTTAEASKRNKENRQPIADDADRQKLVAGILSALKNKALSQNDRARYVLQKLGPHHGTGPRGQTWTPNALIKWARKRRIAI